MERRSLSSIRRSSRLQGKEPQNSGLKTNSIKRIIQKGQTKINTLVEEPPSFVQHVRTLFEGASEAKTQDPPSSSTLLGTSPSRPKRPSFEVPLEKVENTLIAASQNLEEATIIVTDLSEHKDQVEEDQVSVHNEESDSEYSEPEIAVPAHIKMANNPLFNLIDDNLQHVSTVEQLTMDIPQSRPIDTWTASTARATSSLQHNPPRNMPTQETLPPNQIPAIHQEDKIPGGSPSYHTGGNPTQPTPQSDTSTNGQGGEDWFSLL